jgi:hypothetical protein
VAYHAYYPFGEEATDASQDELALKFMVDTFIGGISGEARKAILQ